MQLLKYYSIQVNIIERAAKMLTARWRINEDIGIC